MITMIDDHDSIQKQIEQMVSDGPHVVILGAGATMAAIPEGDKNGVKSSVMNDFIKNLHLDDVMKGVKLRTRSRNLESIFSELCEHPEYVGVRDELEQKIYSFYSSLIIPDRPTAYDYLILSLRDKDSIFSFNWDNLLVQAYSRCMKITTNLPQMYFLHGNVGVSYCKHCHILQKKSNYTCIKCGKVLEPTQLLYPVKNKDYTASQYLQEVWGTFEKQLDTASILTVFGYSAPKTDVAAKKIMRNAFANRIRWYDQFEVVDKADSDKIYKTWDTFIAATHGHIEISDSIFKKTLIGEFPRRTVEGYVKRNLTGWWGTSAIQLHECKDFPELEELLKPLIVQEENGDYSVIPIKHYDSERK